MRKVDYRAGAGLEAATEYLRLVFLIPCSWRSIRAVDGDETVHDRRRPGRRLYLQQEEVPAR